MAGCKYLSPKDVALGGLLRDGYLIYTQLSADAAHPTVTSLNRHVGHRETNNEAVVEVAPVPNDAEVTMTWDWACNAMLGACVAVNEILGGTQAGQKLEQIAERYKALRTGRKAAPVDVR